MYLVSLGETSPYPKIVEPFRASSSSLTNEFRKGDKAKLNIPKGGMKGLLAKTKPMARSDLASEAVWRPKQPRGICLKKYGGYLNLVNEFQFAVKNQEVLLTTRVKPMARSDLAFEAV